MATSETDKNDTLSTPAGMGPEVTKPKPPTSLKVAVGFVIAYGLLLFFDTLGSESTPYLIGSRVGIIVFCSIIVLVLIKVKKYGWGFSVFYISGKIFEHVSTCRKASQAISDPELLGAIIIGNVLFIILLLGALVALIMPQSRKPFKKLHKKSKECP